MLGAAVKGILRGLGGGNVAKMAMGYGIYQGTSYAQRLIDEDRVPGYTIGGGYSASLGVLGTLVGGGMMASGAIGTVGKLTSRAGVAAMNKTKLRNFNEAKLSEINRSGVAMRKAASYLYTRVYYKHLVRSHDLLKVYAARRLGQSNKLLTAGAAIQDFSVAKMMGKGAGFIGKTVGAGLWGIAKAPFTVASDVARMGRAAVSPSYRAGITALSFADYGHSMSALSPLVSMGSRAVGWGAAAGAVQVGYMASTEQYRDPSLGVAMAGQQEWEPTSGGKARRMREDPSFYSTMGLVQSLHANR